MNALEHAGLLAINSVEFPGSMRSRQALFCKDTNLWWTFTMETRAQMGW